MVEALLRELGGQRHQEGAQPVRCAAECGVTAGDDAIVDDAGLGAGAERHVSRWVHEH